jgi:hypothetical protein
MASEYVFRLDVKASTYSCLRAEAYVNGSSEYIFNYGCGGIGRVWTTRTTEVIDVYTVALSDFYRRDLGLMHGIRTVTIAYVDEDTILETAVSKRLYLNPRAKRQYVELIGASPPSTSTTIRMDTDCSWSHFPSMTCVVSPSPNVTSKIGIRRGASQRYDAKDDERA